MSKGDEVREVLICSGLDPSGGAGFLADVHVVNALGCRAVGVVTSLTVQNTVAVQQVQPVESEVVGAQLAALLGDVEVHAVKIGLVGSVAIAKEIAYGLELTAAPVVWDPIGAPTRGRISFDGPSFDEMLPLFLPHLRLITPNARELEELAQRRVSDRASAIDAAKSLGVPVLVKGGHFDDDPQVADILVDGDKLEVFEGTRIAGGESVHGTGCALSSAIAARLARGDDLATACRHAKEFVASRIATPVRPGRGASAVV